MLFLGLERGNRNVCTHEDVEVNPTSSRLSKYLCSVCRVVIHLMRRSNTDKTADHTFYCCVNDKWISLNSLKTSYGRHLSPVQGFPLVPASIHAVARKKYFDDKWVMFQKLVQINRRCLRMCSSVCGTECVHLHGFVSVCACVFWAAGSIDWYVFPSVAVGWVWKPICSTRSMVL